MKTKNSLYNWFFLLIFLFVLIILYKILKSYFLPLLWAGIFAIVLFPIYSKINKKLKGKANLSSFIATAVAILVLVLPLFLLLSSLAIEAFDFYSNAETKIDLSKINESVDKIVENKYVKKILPSETTTNLKNKFNIEETNLIKITSKAFLTTSQKIVNISQNIIKDLTSFVFNFFITIFALFFIFRDGKSFYNYVIELLPMDKETSNEISSIFYKTTKVIVLGNLAVAAVQGVLVGLIFWILGINYPVLSAAISFILSILPLVGSLIVWLPVGIYLLISGAFIKGIILILFGVFVISLSDNLLRPLIIGKQTRLHTLFLFLCIMGGIAQFGFSGIIIGPLALAIFLSIVEIYKGKYLANPGLKSIS